MIEFKTQYDERKRIYAPVGDRVHPDYECRIDDDGYWEIVQTGETNLYDEIQSHKMSCDINYILARYASGDSAVLSRKQGVYADFSQMPKTYAEMLNAVSQATSTFESLPLDIRNQFGNSMEVWLSSYGTDDWCKKMGYDSPSVSDDVVVDQKVGESE